MNAALYATQLPNPETGETVGLGDVLWSATGVVFADGGALKAVRALGAIRLGNATRLANGNIVNTATRKRDVPPGDVARQPRPAGPRPRPAALPARHPHRLA